MLKCASIILVFATVFLLNYGEATSPTKKTCLGCVQDIKLDDKGMRKSLAIVLKKQNAGVIILKIVSAKYQVVNGMKYTVEFEAKDTATKEKKYCSSTYISRPWKKEVKIIDFQCNSK
uniref:Venom cystatin 2 n=1 Tax=Oncocephalus sp. TaxID=2944721 RepID=A0AB38ZEL1_9HEMI